LRENFWPSANVCAATDPTQSTELRMRETVIFFILMQKNYVNVIYVLRFSKIVPKDAQFMS
jgi:hypothetical protein